MRKEFKTKLIEIKNIGDELRFQREYYNFKQSPYKLTPRMYNGRKSKYLGEVLKEFMENEFDYTKYMKHGVRNFNKNYGEYGANETMLYDIEHNKIRKSKEANREKYNINSYYLRIYSLFKIYGFLDDYEIIMLLDKYKVNPYFEQSEKEIRKIKEKCFLEYKENPIKSAFNLKKWIIVIPSSIMEDLLSNNTTNLKNTKKFVGKNIVNKKMTLQFLSLKKYMLNYFSELSSIEKKCISLELGKETGFIEDVLEGNIEYITLETLLKIIDKVKELKNTDFEYLIKRDIEEQNGDNILETEKDVFNFRKKWGI